ncbi:uncharacterized protein LOC128124437 isoform X4 [Peromyscus californicus insignis]|uniref:uncharacterized protein LOC128124437 isoform X4 n=1 Tax=Peromyscus californicus insignis TaxID=564181 RepID=UPI0022A791A3|nr:uncharacterized protein LOC128124437 isoform X4 [Peromyscus californicus insignis]
MRLEVGMQRGSGGRSRSPELSPSPGDLFCSWEEDRKVVLRGWSLVFISLATLLVFSVVDGQMAYVHGPYTGFIGLWIDCRRHKCANTGQVTVYIHMSKGFMFLALALCLILLPTMFLSFRPVCRRLNKIDYIFSFLSIGVGTLSFLNQVRRGSYSTPIMERRVSYFRWALRHQSQQQSNLDQSLESIQNQSAATSQDTGKSRQPDASTSVPVTPSPSDLP